MEGMRHKKIVFAVPVVVAVIAGYISHISGLSTQLIVWAAIACGVISLTIIATFFVIVACTEAI